STQFLNDRLLVNGNFGYRENNMTTLDEPAGNSGIIDFDIEYKLNPSGKFRTKAFNRYDNSYFRQNSNGTTQGVGLIYREDFDTYSEWMNRYWHPVKSVFTRKKKKKQ
ncbi:MAG: translocation/assembly module TamB, partial [Paludibacteraceae bacterium]|nr:translocation/assembly module TamB [Paludibacteraceae bacterium]